MSERRGRAGWLFLVAALAAAGGGLAWRLAAGSDSRLDRAAEPVRARNQKALAALARALAPRVLQASRHPQLVAALDAQVDTQTLQDIIDTEESWAGVRQAFPVQVVLAGGRVVARSGPPLREPALTALLDGARASGVASGLLSSEDGGAFLAAAGLVNEAKRVAADHPMLVLGEPADDALLARLSQGTGDAVGLSDGRRLLASGGPEALRSALGAAVGRESEGAWRVQGRALAVLPVAPELWLLVAFIGASAGVGPGPSLLFGLAAVLAAVGVMLLARRARPAPSRASGPSSGPPAHRDDPVPSIHQQPTQIGQAVTAPAAERPAPAHTSHVMPAVAAAALPRRTPPYEMGRYRLLKPLGEGGMAEVYLAEAHGAEGFKRRFVVKRLHAHLAARAEVVAQFIDEARLQARLLHSNIVPVFDFGRAGDEYFLALEYVHGRDLEKLTHRQLQATERGLPAPLVFFVMHEVLEALDYAHNRGGPTGEPLGIVHRDISPANILISFLGEVKLSDFGIVKAAGRVSKTDERVVKGNVSFMSPEQARGDAVDARSDLFSAGMVMFYCLTGRTLYSGDGTINQLMRAAVGPVTEQFRQLGDLPPEATTILNRALALDPAARFQSAGEFARALRVLNIASKSDLAYLMQSYYSQEMKLDF
jgi:hypothetical protein